MHPVGRLYIGIDLPFTIKNTIGRADCLPELLTVSSSSMIVYKGELPNSVPTNY